MESHSLDSTGAKERKVGEGMGSVVGVDWSRGEMGGRTKDMPSGSQKTSRPSHVFDSKDGESLGGGMKGEVSLLV